MKKLLSKLNRFLFLGLALAYSPDAIPQYKYSIARNIRQYRKGIIESRFGMTPLNASAVAATNIHSIHRLNDDTPTAAQTYTRIIGGANGTVYTDNSAHTSFTSRSTGFSGNPLTFATFRPNNSPSPYTYIGDSTKMEKITVAGSVSKMGIIPPTTPPSATRGAPTLTRVDDFTTTGWTQSGIAFAPSAVGGAWTITTIMYDTGSTGWANVEPSVFGQLSQEGAFLRFVDGANIEIAVIDKVLKAIKTTTISSITYDSGTTGLCTIVLSAMGRKNLEKNTIIQIDSEKVRVLSVTIGDDDTKSFRCSTTSNHTAGATVTGIKTLRVYLTLTHTVATGTIAPRALQVTTSGAAGTAQIDKTSSLDLSSVGGREIQDSDEMCFAVNIDFPQYVTELQLYLFTTNATTYYYKSYRPSDFDPITAEFLSTIAANQKALQNQAIDKANVPFDVTLQEERERLQRKFLRLQLDGADPQRLEELQQRINKIGNRIIRQATNPDVYSNPTTMATGLSATSTLKCKISDLKRVGGDAGVSLKDIASIRILFTVNEAQVVQAQFTGWWIGGSYGADVAQTGMPYQHRYRYRSKTTGAVSYWSPPDREGLSAKRERMQLVPVASADSQVDAIDWCRRGGSNPIWKYIGTGANSTATFNDDFPDDAIFTYEEAQFNNFVPFVVADLPRTGVCNVSGTKVTRVSGDLFNTNWIEGNEIVIDGKPFILYGSPSTTGLLETAQNVGTKSNVTFYLPSPALMNTALPAICAYVVDKAGTVILGCGDTLNAGVLYWTNPDDPDSMGATNYVDVTSPSEPLMNLFVYDSRAYVWTPENLYAIYPTQDLTGALQFYATKTPLSKGIAGRYAFCLGEGAIWFVDRDGIYYTNGSQPQSITDEDLYPLFPHDGNVGSTINGFIPPDFSSPNNLRLAVGDNILRFEYLGTDTNRYTLIYDIVNKAWSVDEYSPDVVMSYFDEGRTAHNWILGCTDGRIYTNTGIGDGVSSNTAFTSQVRTNWDDLGSPRARKFFADAALDFEASSTGLNVTATLGFDNFVTTLTPVVLNASIANQRQISALDINSGSGIYAKNIGLDVQWIVTTERAKIENWQFSYAEKEDDAGKKATDIDDAGLMSAKWFQGFLVKANTYGVDKTFKIQADNGVNNAWTDIQSFTLTTSNEATKEFSFDTPFIAHNVRLVATDDDSWSLTDVQYVYEPDSELVEEWIGQPTTFGFVKYPHIGWMYVSHRSTADWMFTWIIDNVAYDYPILHSSGIMRKDFIRLKSIKGKIWQPKATTSVPDTGFRLYKNDIAVAIKEWGSGDGYQIIKPVGAKASFTNGALI